MTPSVWSVLVIFILAPLGVVMLVTAVVFLLVSPSRQSKEASADGSLDEDSGKRCEDDVASAGEGDPPA